MKTLIFERMPDMLQEAPIIEKDTVKGTITGRDENGNELWAWSGITDFSLYTCEEGFDEPEPDEFTQLQLALAELAEMILEV